MSTPPMMFYVTVYQASVNVDNFETGIQVHIFLNIQILR